MPQHHVSPSDPNTSGIDPLWVLWEALGNPTPARAAMNLAGRCSRCRSTTDHATRVKTIVSDKFTGWDKYTQDRDPLWCVPCVWGHTDPEMRTTSWIISGSRNLQATPELLAQELGASLDRYVAVTVPLSRKKHILPDALWGHITTDDRVLAWGASEAQRFQHVVWLRSMGFSEAALREPAPRFEQLTTLNDAAMNLVMKRWDELAPWRRDPTYMNVACVASRTSKAPTSAVDAA